MHPGAVPVRVAERLAVILDVDAVFFAKTLKNVAGCPHFVGGLFRALAENLELPLALGHLGVDAFMIDAGVETQIEMLLDDLARDVADILIADARVIGPLRRGKTMFGEAERTSVLKKEILLLEAEPGAGIVENGGARVGRMRGDAIRHHHFAQNEGAVLARGIGIDGDRLQHAIRAAPLGLLGGAAVEAPKRQLLKRRKVAVFLDLRLAAKVWHWFIAIEPNVLELVFRHMF